MNRDQWLTVKKAAEYRLSELDKRLPEMEMDTTPRGAYEYLMALKRRETLKRQITQLQKYGNDHFNREERSQ